MGKIINNALRHRHATGRTCMHLLSLAFNCIKRLQMQTQKCFCMLLDRLENG